LGLLRGRLRVILRLQRSVRRRRGGKKGRRLGILEGLVFRPQSKRGRVRRYERRREEKTEGG